MRTVVSWCRAMRYITVMAKRIASFADLIDPVSEATFFAEYHDRRPLHIPAPDHDKFADVMSWEILNRILNMTAIWSATSLQMVLDKDVLAPEQYCRQAIDRYNRPTLEPEPAKVKRWLQRGASIVANDVDTLSPGLAAAANALEQRLGAKSQSNLYCSWQSRQAFDSHFDTHEVYALHIAGEKTWRIFDGRLEQPIAHESYKSLPQEYNDRNKGKVAMEVTLKPGDLLYIPRGQFHDALAQTDGAIHVAFGLTHVIGVDVLGIVFDHALRDQVFRRNLPLPAEGEDASRDHLRRLSKRLAELADSDAVAADIQRFRAGYHYHRGGVALPSEPNAEVAD